MSFEQVVHTEVLEAVDAATENDGVLTEQDREDQEVQNSLRMIERMYDHENNPDDAEARNWVLVGITKAAMEHSQDPQEIADLIFGEGVLIMREFLADAFETLEDGTRQINYRLPNGDVMRGTYNEEIGIIAWTDMQRLDNQTAARINSRYTSNSLFQFSRVNSFEQAVEASRQRIWGEDEEPLTADVRDTTSIDGNGDGEQVDELPLSITLDVNPDGNITTVDEDGREIELTFDELLARLATTHDKQWALAQVENISTAYTNGILSSISDNPHGIKSVAITNIFENPNLSFSVDEIIQFFSSLHVTPNGLELSFPNDILREIADTFFSDNYDLSRSLYLFRDSLDDASRDIFDTAMGELQNIYEQELVKSVYIQTGVRLNGELIQNLIGYSSYLMRNGHTLESVSQELGIPIEYFANSDGSVAFRRGFPGVSKDDISF